MSFKDCLNRAALRGMIKDGRLSEAIDMFDSMEREFLNAGLPAEIAARRASEKFTETMKSQALRKKQLAILAHSTKQKMDADMDAYRTETGKQNETEALIQKMEGNGTGGFASVNSLHNLYRGRFGSMLADFIDEYGKGIGIKFRKLEGLDDVGKVLFNEKVDDATANVFGKAVKEAFEYMRVTANSLGADIAKKERFGLPQRHNLLKVKKAGREAWIKNIMPLLDFKLMRDASGRSLDTLSMEEKIDALKNVYETIATDGYIKKPKGQGGGGSLANRLGQHRFLEFKDFSAWEKYNDAFGDGDVFTIVMEHLDDMSRTIAMLEVFGPNPEAMFRYAKQRALNKAAERDIAQGGGKTALATIGQQLDQRTADDLWAMLNMRNGILTNDRLGFTFAGIRNLIVSAFLGSATLAAVPGDMVTVRMAKSMSKLPSTKFMENYLKNWSDGGNRKLAIRLGLIADAATAIAGTHNRYMGDMLGPQWTNKVSDFVLRANGMIGHTQAARWAHGMEWLGYFADAASKDFDSLEVVGALKKSGITKNDWDIFKSTKMYEHEGATFLRPDDVLDRADEIGAAKARAVADKFQTFVLDEMHRAVPDSSMRSRTFLVGSSNPGTLSGEILRSFGMFKNFPVTINMMLYRNTMMQDGLSSRIGFAATYGLMFTAVGALTVQMQQLAKGRDPINMNPTNQYGMKFWGQAALTGGGLGIWGDFLFRDVNRFGGGIGSTLAGPVAGLAGDTAKLTFGNALQIAQGEETKFAPEFVDYVRRYMPGGNIWYARAMLQNGIMDSLQRNIDPDAYVKWQRQQSMFFKDYGQSSWWGRGQSMPQRAPNFAKTIE